MNPSDSGESSEPAAQDAEAEANRLKADGNTAFKRKDYASAIDAYSQAIYLTPDSHLLYSNRSAAYLIIKEWESAIHDARKCLELEPSFLKAYPRLGAALIECGLYKEARQVLEQGMSLVDKPDADLKRLLPMAIAGIDPRCRAERPKRAEFETQEKIGKGSFVTVEGFIHLPAMLTSWSRSIGCCIRLADPLLR